VKKNKRKKILNEITAQLKKFGETLTLDDLITIGVGAWAWKHTNRPLNALHGMIGYKLARAPNLPASLAGIGILAGVGISGMPMAGEDVIMWRPLDEDPPVQCPPGYRRKWSILGGWQCVKIYP